MPPEIFLSRGFWFVLLGFSDKQRLNLQLACLQADMAIFCICNLKLSASDCMSRIVDCYAAPSRSFYATHIKNSS